MEPVYRKQVRISRDEYIQEPCSKLEYIALLMQCEDYVDCVIGDRQFGIENGQSTEWRVTTSDGAEVTIWHTNKDYEAAPEDYLFRFTIGAMEFRMPLKDVDILNFLRTHFVELWNYNKTRTS